MNVDGFSTTALQLLCASPRIQTVGFGYIGPVSRRRRQRRRDYRIYEGGTDLRCRIKEHPYEDDFPGMRTKCDVHLFTLSHAPEAHYVKLTPLILASSGHRPDRLSPEIRVLETEIACQTLECGY